MCIRDRDVDEAFSTSLLEVDGVAGLTQMSSMRSSLDDTIAVSYTHLDVYKRQP